MAQSKVPGVLAFDMQAKAADKPDFEVVVFENQPYPDEPLTYADLVLKGTRLARVSGSDRPGGCLLSGDAESSRVGRRHVRGIRAPGCAGPYRPTL